MAASVAGSAARPVQRFGAGVGGAVVLVAEQAQAPGEGGQAQQGQGFVAQLADALAAQVQLAADLGQGLGGLTVQAVMGDEHPPQADRQAGQGLVEGGPDMDSPPGVGSLLRRVRHLRRRPGPLRAGHSGDRQPDVPGNGGPGVGGKGVAGLGVEADLLRYPRRFWQLPLPPRRSIL